MSGLRKRIAQALWRSRRLHSDPSVRPYVAWLVDADAVIAALRLREIVDGEGHYWQTPWERTEEDA